MALWAQYTQAIQNPHTQTHLGLLHKMLGVQFYKQQLQPSTSLHNITKL